MYRKILPPKTENFPIKLWYFSYFCSKHRSWVLVRTASIYVFLAEIRKIMYTPENPFYYIKVGFKEFKNALAFEILIKRYNKCAGLGGSVGCAVRLETRRSRVQPPPRSATFFHGDWSWNIFYGHSLPSADSRRAVVSFWRKNVHNTG